MKRGFLQVFIVCFLFAVGEQIFAESYVRVKPTNSQPAETEVYEREIAPFAQFIMNPITPLNNCRPIMLQSFTVLVDNLSEFDSAVNKFVLILEKSKGVDRVNEGRVVARGFYGGSDYVGLYPIHGDNIFDLRDQAKATVSIVMNDNLDDFSGDLSLFVTNIHATWTNGSTVKIKGYLPVIGATKSISNELEPGVVNEIESVYGTSKYEVPEESRENVVFRKIFIYGKRKNLKLLVKIGDAESKKFRCRHNSYITSCDFGGSGIVVPKGSTITITASEQNIFYSGFEALDIFCEGEESGRRIFVSPLSSDGKG